MKINKKRIKEIERKVNSYVKSKEVKDDEGVVIDNIALVVAPETLFTFFTSGALSGLSRKEAFYAKQFFKSLLPFQEYRKTRGKNKDLRIADIIHYQELIEGGEI